MADTADRPGVAHLVLAPGVAHLDPETTVFGAMLDGWAAQQCARFLQPATIEQRRALLRRLAEFTNDYPWNWQCADLEEFIASCRRGTKPIVVSTARIYEITLRQFLTYVTDPRYGWPQECRDRFGVAPRQLLHEENSIVRVTEHEGDPRRRPSTYDEIQALFDAADARVEQIRAHHRKGAAAAMRDAALLKSVYAFGIRRREAWGLDLADLRHNPKAPQFGRFGALFVRWGKSSRGSPPKRWTVLTVPEMDWIVPVLEQWCTEVPWAPTPSTAPSTTCGAATSPVHSPMSVAPPGAPARSPPPSAPASLEARAPRALRPGSGLPKPQACPSHSGREHPTGTLPARCVRRCPDLPVAQGQAAESVALEQGAGGVALGSTRGRPHP
ncbi:site-specific integrase [Rhodococcus opacus]|uniref:site-specific integrase n=1 Tax=Rhodococcus opacus TaxID=37919 RepID=UPI0035E3F162